MTAKNRPADAETSRHFLDAVKSGHVWYIKNRLERFEHALVDMQEEGTQFSALHICLQNYSAEPEARECFWQMFDTLMAHKPDVNKADHEGRTPLYYAVIHENPSAVARLLQAGADIGIGDNAGRTPWDHMWTIIACAPPESPQSKRAAEFLALLAPFEKARQALIIEKDIADAHSGIKTSLEVPAAPIRPRRPRR